MNGLLPAERMTPDELLFRLGDALSCGRLNGWAAKFAASISRQSKRRGWGPSEKQMNAMRQVVRELRAPAEALIEKEEDEKANAPT